MDPRVVELKAESNKGYLAEEKRFRSSPDGVWEDGDFYCPIYGATISLLHNNSTCSTVGEHI